MATPQARDNRSPRKKPYYKKKSQQREEAPKLIQDKVRAYGEIAGDGYVQLSFTLPTPANLQSTLAAQMFAEQMNLKKVVVTHMEAIADDMTNFVVEGYSETEIDMSKIVEPLYEYPVFTFEECNQLLKNKIKRRIVTLGAALGSEAESLSLDALFNIKGYMGHGGFESYPMIDAFNLRSIVNTSDFIQEIQDKQADVIVVSRMSANQEEHIKELKKIAAEINAAPDMPESLIKICMGPRLTHQEATDLGFDAGFGPGTVPSEVVSYIVGTLIKS